MKKASEPFRRGDCGKRKHKDPETRAWLVFFWNSEEAGKTGEG